MIGLLFLQSNVLLSGMNNNVLVKQVLLFLFLSQLEAFLGDLEGTDDQPPQVRAGHDLTAPLVVTEVFRTLVCLVHQASLPLSNARVSGTASDLVSQVTRKSDGHCLEQHHTHVFPQPVKQSQTRDPKKQGPVLGTLRNLLSSVSV